MKVWVKLLIGSILGITLGLLVHENQRLVEALVWLEQFALRIGRYAVIPMLVFLLTIGIYELWQDRQFWPLVLKNCLMIAGVSILVIFLGVLATLAFPPSRIPILAEEQLEVIRLDVAGNVKELFSYNMFSVLAGDGVYLFPVCVFAFFLGVGLSQKRSYNKPVIALVDSLSHVFYNIALFFIEILGFIMIVLSCYWAIRFREVLRAEIYLDLILLLGIFAAVLGFGILPMLLYFVRPKVNPWAVLYGSLGPAIAAFFSGDVNFSLPVLLSHAQENLGVQRRSNAVSLTLFSTFCRAGSAMAATVAFIVIFKSYSSLGITSAEILSISIRALAISFLLARHPGDGAYTALAVLCLGYGKGFEAGYLILKPLAFYLIAVGAFLDVMIASFAAYAAARVSGFVEEKNTHGARV
ncbi:MAG: cation:dicarboxylase symporter family transporter [Treponema sp.]|jgi:Na+/H+-dicarboxylate symporter|nr:cation:dicarboxylase symporter family transporter [Treponema sp.]